MKRITLFGNTWFYWIRFYGGRSSSPSNTMVRAKKKARQTTLLPEEDHQDSSPGTILLTNSSAPAPKADWSSQCVSDLVGTEVEWSTITADTRLTGGRKKKTCLFCGHEYTGGPHDIRQHLDAGIKPRHVSVL